MTIGFCRPLMPLRSDSLVLLCTMVSVFYCSHVVSCCYVVWLTPVCLLAPMSLPSLPEIRGAHSSDAMVTESSTLFLFRQFCTGEFRLVFQTCLTSLSPAEGCPWASVRVLGKHWQTLSDTKYYARVLFSVHLPSLSIFS
jgi:hypothetical protein